MTNREDPRNYLRLCTKDKSKTRILLYDLHIFSSRVKKKAYFNKYFNTACTYFTLVKYIYDEPE